MYDQQNINLNFKSSNTEEYNNPFNLLELKEAINKSHDTAIGPDEVHYQMLKRLPPSSLQALLDIYIMTSGKQEDFQKVGNYLLSYQFRNQEKIIQNN